MFGSRIEIHQTRYTVVYYMPPCGKHEAVVAVFKPLYHVLAWFHHAGESVAVPQAVVVFAATGTDERQVGIAEAVGIFECQTFVYGM